MLSKRILSFGAASLTPLTVDYLVVGGGGGGGGANAGGWSWRS